MMLPACGGQGGSIGGSVHGKTLSINAAASAIVTTSGGGQTSGEAEIALSSDGSLCSDLGANVLRKNESGILLTLYDVDASNNSTAPTAPGTYTIYTQNGPPPPKSAVLLVNVLDDHCQDLTADEARAMSGSVTLGSVSGNVFAGSFDVMLDSGDHLTGSFAPDACPALQTAMSTSADPTCK